MNPITSTIFICIVLSGLANAVILPILAPLIRELHLTATQGGLMISIGSIIMALTASFWGATSDKYGRRPIILIGFSGLFISYGIFTTTVWLGLHSLLISLWLFVCLCLGRAVVGSFLPAVPTAAQALMADNTNQAHRTKGMAVITAANGIGLILGPALSGLLAVNGLIWPLFTSMILCLLAFVVAMLTLPKQKPVPRQTPMSLSPFLPELRPWLFSGVLTWFSIAAVQVSTGFYFQDKLGLSTAQTASGLAIALTLVGVFLFLTQVLLKPLSLSPKNLVVFGTLIWMIAFSILLFTKEIHLFFIAYGVMGIGAGMSMPGYMAGASLSVSKDHQGAVAGFSAATQGVGFILGPVTSTVLYDIAPNLPLYILITLMGVLALFFLFSKNNLIKHQ